MNGSSVDSFSKNTSCLGQMGHLGPRMDILFHNSGFSVRIGAEGLFYNYEQWKGLRVKWKLY